MPKRKLDPVLKKALTPGTKENKQLEESRARWKRRTKPLLARLRASELLTADDFAVTINCTEPLSSTANDKKKR